MTLPASGTIAISQIATEFGGSTPHAISEYYRAPNGLTTANNTGVPLSGTISMSNFYSAQRKFVYNVTINSATANFNWYNNAVANGWNQSDPVVCTLTNNSWIYESGIGNYAFYISGFPGGSELTIVNNGYIVGQGGNGGGAGAGGGSGGHAIYAGSAVTIYNYGGIYGGGGGGGGGGGYYGYNASAFCESGVWCYAGGGGGGGGATYTGNSGGSYGGNSGGTACGGATAGSGAAGGTGGGGGGGVYGYLYSRPGSDPCGGKNPCPQCDACDYASYVYGGSGGTGGGWGAYGNSGGNGSVYGSGITAVGYWYYGQAGGSPGYYTYGNSNVTWAATGSRAGLVA